MELLWWGRVCLSRVCDTATQAKQGFTLEAFYSPEKSENINVQ